MTVLTMIPARLELRRDPEVPCTPSDDEIIHGDGSCTPQLELELEMEQHDDPSHVIYIQPLLQEQSSSSSSSCDSSRSLAYKTVRFSIQPTKVHDHIHRRDITPEEKSLVWTSSAEMRYIRLDVQKTREMMSSGSLVSDTLTLSTRTGVAKTSSCLVDTSDCFGRTRETTSHGN
ncbi:hypothetical protein MHU86_9027 [Fragilaria crotonensis]|nr:hypothetical protein MHU86_9027 [Fragilaria crotonensis]